MSTSASARLPESVPETSWTPGTTLTVVAHPDDDLYFINPNIVRAIRRGGAEVVGVVVTAAEGDGRNVDTDDPQRMASPIDYPGYATARQRGLRRAYAKMAGRPADSSWRNTVVTMLDGLQVQCSVLIADPRVRLYFVAVAHTYDADGRDHSTVAPLWDGTLRQAPTMPSADASRPVQQVTRAGLIACLTELLRRHRPAVIRTLDPDPEHDWGKTDFVVSDHPDHTAVARFTLAAVRGYADATGAGPLVEHYRGYANRYWPRNLGTAEHTEKASFVQTYAGADGSSCAAHDCGDYQLGKNPYRSTHIYSTAERYGPSTSWLARGADGAMVAAAAVAGRVAVWAETVPGSGSWTGPQHLDGGWITPSLVVVAGKDGRTHLVGLRRTEGSGGAVTVDVVHAVRTGSGAFSAWRSLDGPDSADPDRRRQREVGVPTATVDAAGRLWVFARNFQGTLSARQERSGGRWSAWRSLGGGLLQDSPSALTTSAGLVEVLAPGKKVVYRWRQRTPGGALLADQAGHPTPVASNGLHAVESGGGRVCLYYRKAGSGALLAYREKAASGGGWPNGPEQLGGQGGTGPVATAGRLDAGARDAVLAHRNHDYGTSVAYPGRLVHDKPVWHRAPGVIAGGPSLAFDQSGRLVLAVLGQDGRLHVKRQRAAKPNVGFGPWLTV
jgi:LmbE family N-acetylglucosaminyl deacetylase